MQLKQLFIELLKWGGFLGQLKIGSIKSSPTSTQSLMASSVSWSMACSLGCWMRLMAKR